jgi:hypothetical protein
VRAGPSRRDPENIGKSAPVNQSGLAELAPAGQTGTAALALAKRSPTAFQLTTFHQAPM